MSKSAEARQFVRKMERDGWRKEMTGGCHYKLHHPAGIGFIIISFSPSDRRWIQNAKRDIRQLERERGDKAPGRHSQGPAHAEI